MFVDIINVVNNIVNIKIIIYDNIAYQHIIYYMHAYNNTYEYVCSRTIDGGQYVGKVIETELSHKLRKIQHN